MLLFGQMLATTQWDDVRVDCASEAADRHRNKLDAMVEAYFPIKVKKVKECDLLWINRSIKRKIRRKKRKYKRERRSPGCRKLRDNVKNEVRTRKKHS